jgi:preprotein translocase subunit SecA
MAGANGVEFDLPELATLREEAVAQEIERQRRMEAMADGEGLDDLDDDLSADDFLDEEDLPDLPPALDDRRPRVTAPLRRDPATPGRNDPCPCGSGKKYKKCCLNKSA